jgi:hypothetical protein
VFGRLNHSRQSVHHCLLQAEKHWNNRDMKPVASCSSNCTRFCSQTPPPFLPLLGQCFQTSSFFLVVNHGIDTKFIAKAHEFMDDFFGMHISEKQKAQRKIGDHCGYASSFTGRFSSKLPWKETLSFRYCAGNPSSKIVEDYIVNVMGEDFKQFG